MEKCLVKKFERVVNNDNLDYFGYAQLEVVGVVSNNYTQVEFSEDVVVKAIVGTFGDGTTEKTVIANTPTNLGLPTTLGENEKVVYLIPKYSLKSFTIMNNMTLKNNIEDLKWSLTNLSKLFYPTFNQDGICDISGLNFSNIPDITITGYTAYCDFDSVKLKVEPVTSPASKVIKLNLSKCIGDYLVFCKKYNIPAIEGRDTAWKGELKDININNLEGGYTELKQIFLYASNGKSLTNVYGSLNTAFAGSPDMTQINIWQSTHLTGNLNTLFSAWVTAGRTTGTCTISVQRSKDNITYNDNPLTTGKIMVTFDSSAPNGYTVEDIN